MMSGKYEYDLMATRRKDPDYEQVSGYVHKDLALKFRIICTTERLTQSELLEEALKILIELKNNKEHGQTGNSPTETPYPPTTVAQITATETDRTNNSPETKTPLATKAKQGNRKKES